MKLKYRIAGLAVIFLAALLFWAGSFRKDRQNPAGLKSFRLAEPVLPVIWAESCGKRMDVMRGYLTEESGDPDADTLILLPEDRRLRLSAEEGRVTVTGLRYEIRSADGADLIERTEVPDREENERGFTVVLPIQNLLKKDREYRLEITLSTAEKGEVHYYGRIGFDTTGMASAMLSLAEDFSVRNFDYNTARENTTFLETDETGDNSTLARVDLKANFSQLTYGKLKLVQNGEADLRLLEYNGSMGVIRRRFLASGDEEDGDQMLYEVCEDFVMRKGPERIYMMDYTRTMNEVFLGDAGRLEDNRVVIGIGGEAELQSLSAGRYTAFVSAGDLWLADGEKNRLVRVWSFRSGTDSGIRSGFEKHGVKILRLEEDGALSFLLYGYMNRGAREGQEGVSLMRFDADGSTVEELLFLPLNGGFSSLAREIGTLARLGENRVLYLKLPDAVYGIDITSGAAIRVSPELKEGSYAVSADQSRLAFQEESGPRGSRSVIVLNLDTGEQKQLAAEAGRLLRPVGFIDRDLAVGSAEEGSVWILNGREREYPFSSVEIVDDQLEPQAHYAESGIFYTDVSLQGDRIRLQKLWKTGENSFAAAGEDTLVCNVKPEQLPSTPSFTTDLREKTWYMNAPQGLKKQGLKTEAPSSFAAETAFVLKPAKGAGAGYPYRAFGRGRLTAECGSAGEAVRSAYAEMGYVRGGGKLLYCRAATAGIRTLKDPGAAYERLAAAREEGRGLDLYGAPYRAVLYYVSGGTPVLGFTDQGMPLVIYAYDTTGVSLYTPEDGGRFRVSHAEAEAIFEAGRNDFHALPRE